MTKTSTLNFLSRLGPISKLFWKIDDAFHLERLAFYIRDDQVTAFTYSLTNGLPTGVKSVETLTASDIVSEPSSDDANGGASLQALGVANGRTYKLIKTFEFGVAIHLLLEQGAGRPDAIVVGEVTNENGHEAIVLRARVEPQQVIKPLKVAS